MRTLSMGLLGVLAALTISGQLTSGQVHAEVVATATIVPSCDVAAPEIAGPVPSLLDAELPDGTVVLGGSYVKAGKLVTVLQAVLPDCEPAQGFGVHGTATVTLAVHSASAVIDVIKATTDGRLLLGGGIGPDLVVGKLLSDGRLDTSFGTAGWARLQAPAKPPKGMFSGYAITALALGPSGMIYLGGNDGTAHCCVQDFVGALNPSGGLERSFGKGGWATLPALDGSYDTEIFPGASGVLVMGFVMYTGCGGPVLVRLDARGRIDSAFDATVRHSLAGATGRYVLIGPALYPRPADGFALVGDLIPSGCQSPAPKLVGKGLALGFRGNGKIDPSFGTAGRTAFTYAGSSGAWAVPLPDGFTVVVTDEVPEGSYGAPRSLDVRELSTAGRFRSTFCRLGTCIVNLSWASASGSYPAIDAMAAPDGSAVIVAAAKQRAKLYQVGP
ncbi:MAG TPA: hypothetical protein VMS00_03455 [Acidimicrobiales bacterium]|nr:hypothetical protein [Acidimicrobiales bacterium]